MRSGGRGSGGAVLWGARRGARGSPTPDAMHLSLGQRFWLFAAFLAAATTAIAAVFVVHQVNGYQRHTRTLELTEAYHAGLAAREALALEYQATQRLLGLPSRGSATAREMLAVRRAATDDAFAALAQERADVAAWTDPDGVLRLAEAADGVASARAEADAQLSRRLEERTADGVERALRADRPAAAALASLLNQEEAALRDNDAGTSASSVLARLAAQMHDQISRQAIDVIPALATGTPVSDDSRRRLVATAAEVRYGSMVLARRVELYADGDERVVAGLRQVSSGGFALSGGELLALARTGAPGDAVGRVGDALMQRAAMISALSDAAIAAGAQRAQDGRDRALMVAVWSIAAAAVFGAALVFFLLWTGRSVLASLDDITRQLAALAHGDTRSPQPATRRRPPEVEALAGAVEGLRRKERRRARLEAEHAALHAQLRHEAVTDALTGLFNRRTVDDIGARWAAGGEDVAESIGVLIADLDHFKAINDTHGHMVGDRVLEITARRLRAGVRPTDTVARYGGEEFVVVAEDITPADLMRLADDLRRRVGEHGFAVEDGGMIDVRMSVGLAHARRGECTWPDLMEAADAALYRAKSGGRDRVELGVVPGAGDAGGAPSGGAVTG